MNKNYKIRNKSQTSQTNVTLSPT